MKKLLASVGLLCMVAIAWPGVVVASGDTTTELDVAAAEAPAPESPAETAPADTAPPDTTPDDTAPPQPAPEAPAPGEHATTTTLAEPDQTAGPDETAELGEPAGQAPPSATPRTATVAGAPSPNGGARVRAQQCEPSYPGICVPPGPDVDCAEIDDRNFSVPGDDPFGFDRDGNGIGCEDDSVPATTAPPTTAPPTTPAPTTAPPPTPAPQVAGTTQTRPATALPVTGGESRTLLLLGVLALGAGIGLIGTGGYATRVVTVRPGGGFTLTLTNPFGEQVLYRVTSRSRFGRLATWWSRRRGR